MPAGREQAGTRETPKLDGRNGGRAFMPAGHAINKRPEHFPYGAAMEGGPLCPPDPNFATRNILLLGEPQWRAGLYARRT